MGKNDDKTEKPTAKKLKDARKQGQIAKTTEFGTWFQVLVATVVTEYTISQAFRGLRGVTGDIERMAADPDPDAALGLLGSGGAVIVQSVLPLGVVMVVVGVVALTSQTGLVLATKAAKPKFSKINPIAGVKRLVSPKGLWQGGKALAKLITLASVSWSPILNITKTLIDAGTLGLAATASEVIQTTVQLARTVALVGIAIGIADFAYQKHSTAKDLKMSIKDIRDESKASDGDQQVKGQIRRRQQEMSQNRMLSGVADASVVIVNPTHIAVAIRYQQGEGAPIVLAKGRGHVADRIREEASKHFVPIVRDIPLARTLEKSCQVDQVIPAELYEAVARLLAFVMQVGRRASLLGGVLENPAAARVAMPDELASH